MMNTLAPRPISISIVLSIAAAAAIGVRTAGAQELAPSSVSAAAPASKPTTGLDSINDDRLVSELVSDGLDNLLDRAMKDMPQARREAVRAMIALQQISNPDSKLTDEQRHATIQHIVAGIGSVLPQLNDPQALLLDGKTLVDAEVSPATNALEYWGEDDATKAQAKPVVDAVAKMYARAAVLAKQNADALADKLTGPSDPNKEQWEKANNLAVLAAYTQDMLLYDQALCLDKADPQRKALADKAIKALKQWDTPDSGVQPYVHLQIAKLYMVLGGKANLTKAKQWFNDVANDPGKKIQPEPNVQQQFASRYFPVVCDLTAGDLKKAVKGQEEVAKWQASFLNQPGYEAAVLLLNYRILTAESEAATDAKAKKQFDDQAVAVLQDLVKRVPAFKGRVFGLLATKLGEHPDVAHLDPLLLAAMIQQGAAEVDRAQRTPDYQPNAVVLQRAMDAAVEYQKRAGQPDIDTQQLIDASLFQGFFLEHLGKPVEAVDRLLQHVQKYKTNAIGRANVALSEAQYLIAQLRKDGNDQASRLEDEFFPIAIAPPFSRTEFAFPYARRLLASGDYAGAANYFATVPDNDKIALSARYLQLDALEKELDQTEPHGKKPLLQGENRGKVIAEIVKLSDDVKNKAAAAMQSATDDKDKARFKDMIVQTTLDQARLAIKEQNDPQRVLTLLNGFEDQIKGMSNEQALLALALQERVRAYMALGNNSQAASELAKFLETTGGLQGVGVATDLLERLNADLDRAQAEKDESRIRQIAASRAALSGFLVNWAEKTTGEGHKFLYRYRVFDAASKRLAAEEEPDEAKRKQELQQVLDLFNSLESPENVALYKETLPPGSDTSESDPQVEIGIGLVAYDLGDCKTVQEKLLPLLAQKKLGDGTRVVRDPKTGQDTVAENDQFWEVTYKTLKCNIELARSGASDTKIEPQQQWLKDLYVQWGQSVGGSKWHEQFEDLRKEIIPDYTPPATATNG